ncbi:MAG TPA: hypothetical protein P5120_04440 [Spirochaetota bacterium]|nr:hypothetical protein [Spirochaetota bacterium]HPF05291.1 hypothetical protein [Spirochaetota bacterium]HPJ41029.1 hypothetical protein [Spirochaetota bacterium]HPR36315.1 hypothetical protein [Spirochaetota bacterium]HRX46746.1 hypothetical protein [Spirochaetota bacterium]
MSTVQELNTLNEFISEMKRLEVKKIAFSEVNERRAEQTKEDLLEVVVIKEVTLKSYKDSVIYKYFEKNDNLDSIYNRLLSEGFEVKRINKNIT